MLSHASTPLLSSYFLLLLFITGTSALENQTMIDGPLFDKYQFLSPGIMMSLVVVFILMMLLYVGVYALSSLEVTYAAFEKESGPTGQKKTQ